jgi:outer membrane protein OmpA-like peptidoglycan-associated protein
MPVSPRPPDPAPDPAALPHELGCPDDFQRFRVGETRLHPYRTNYPAEARFCTGTTAKGCYLRVMNGPAMCGSKPACVMHCPHPVAVPAPVPVLIPVPAPIPVAPQPARAAEAKGAITAEGCETRLAVMGETGAIYFRTGSAELDDASQPLLDSGADIARRCPTVKFEVEGHTDSVGSKRLNQTLSEERAASVVTYLAGKGVAADRIRSVGHGDTRPVARNSSEANRAKNRRIEFKVNGN